jgi:hypothetical protein
LPFIIKDAEMFLELKRDWKVMDDGVRKSIEKIRQSDWIGFPD